MYGVTVPKKDLVCCLCFMIFWLGPYFYSNITLKTLPFYPSFTNYVLRTSNLFPVAVYVWPMPYIQILSAEEGGWITLPEENFFRMQTFGYRTRLFELLYFAKNLPDKSSATQEELARWVAGRYLELNQGKGKPLAVRFVAGLYRADPNFFFKGRWETLPFESFSKDNTYVLSTHRIE
jgi:hypothetical protein